MNAEQSIAIMKALADKSRLAIISSLLEQTQYVEEIAKRHALAPSTVSFHLKKLEQAGIVSSWKEQYYVVVQANEAILNTTLREIISASPDRKDLQDERIDEYRHKTLATFFSHGVLDKLPAQHKKRSIILKEFALRFEAGRRYSESEVTGLIKPLFNDYCVIRRLLVDEGMILRDKATYWREIRDDDQPLETATAPRPLAVKKGDGRAEIKRKYKESRPDVGVYQIKNKVTGKIFIDSTNNLEGTFRSKSFQLKMGKAVFNRELQKDLNELGADGFEISVLEILPKPQSGDNVEQLLLARKLHWQKKMQPFAELGYNSQKKFQREREQL